MVNVLNYIRNLTKGRDLKLRPLPGVAKSNNMINLYDVPAVL